MSDNFQRLLALTQSFFDSKSDDSQLQFDDEVMQRLEQLHEATLSEWVEGDGPVLWILLFPTTLTLQEQFLTGAITEQELFTNTPIGINYECVYLCSASVLPEFQRKGLAFRISTEAIQKIQKDHVIQSLFYWPFSDAGTELANKIASHLNLPIYKKVKS